MAAAPWENHKKSMGKYICIWDDIYKYRSHIYCIYFGDGIWDGYGMDMGPSADDESSIQTAINFAIAGGSAPPIPDVWSLLSLDLSGRQLGVTDQKSFNRSELGICPYTYADIC